MPSSTLFRGHVRKGHVRGFTLIELLVVIAIIGILSSVVLAATLLGRLRAMDAAVKADLHTIQSEMEIYYSTNNNYGAASINNTSPQSTIPATGTSIFFTNANINGALKAAFAQSGGHAYWAVGQGQATWAVAVELKGDSGYWWCIDSSGNPIREPNANMTGTALHGGASSAAYCP